MRRGPAVVAAIDIGSRIVTVRARRVMLDADLARIYGVTTTRLNQQVKRNQERFPPDFMFQLSPEEWRALMLQSATSNSTRGGRRIGFLVKEAASQYRAGRSRRQRAGA